MPPGRPTKYKPEYCKQAAKLCALGAIDKDLAEFFDTTEQTINAWKKEYPEFLEAIKTAKEELDQKVERSLFQRATGYEHPAVKIMQYEGTPVKVDYTERYPPDTVAGIFWLKNRQPDRWRDKIDHEHGGKDGAPIQVNVNIKEKKR